MKPKTALIIGAGPAGLTAAAELLQRTDILPLVIEAGDQLGGLSRTVIYKGNRLDIGGHRFFSHHPEICRWWKQILPLQRLSEEPQLQQMLIRQRHSRILFLGHLYDYPLQLTPKTLRQLGSRRLLRLSLSYLHARLNPINPEQSLEDFLINRFGLQLYRIFFKSYTEKVWGVPCSAISADWGKQRIKGVSIGKALLQALRPQQTGQQVEASLIDQFWYPAQGPGQLWQRVASQVEQQGGRIELNSCVTGLRQQGSRISAVQISDTKGSPRWISVDYVLSGMPVSQLIQSFESPVPEAVAELANALPYRDFITLGLLLDPRKLNASHLINERTADNWLYIQEPGVKLGRVQLYHNWSPFLVDDPDNHLWIGLEYFCQDTDSLWSMSESERLQLAIGEACRCRLINPEAVIDAVQIKVPKAYPAYFGSYAQFDKIRAFTDQIDNLFLIGRNGMHRYSNQDLAMLTAMEAVRLIDTDSIDKESLWNLASTEEYLG